MKIFRVGDLKVTYWRTTDEIVLSRGPETHHFEEFLYLTVDELMELLLMLHADESEDEA